MLPTITYCLHGILVCFVSQEPSKDSLRLDTISIIYLLSDMFINNVIF